MQVEREWEKENITIKIQKAKESKPKDRARLIQKAYDAQEKAIRTAMESVKRKYKTGKKTKTWYSKANVEIRKLRTESDTLQEIWKRKTAQNRENPKEGGSQQARSDSSRKALISAKMQYTSPGECACNMRRNIRNFQITPLHHRLFHRVVPCSTLSPNNPSELNDKPSELKVMRGHDALLTSQAQTLGSARRECYQGRRKVPGFHTNTRKQHKPTTPN